MNLLEKEYNKLAEVKNLFIRDNLATIKKIYLNLRDDKSKKVFLYRMLFNYTGDFDYIAKLVQTNCNITQEHPFILFYNRAKKILDEGGKLIWYGAGEWLKDQIEIYGEERCYNYQLFQSLIWDCICDSDTTKTGVVYNGLKIIGVDELLKKCANKSVYVVLGTTKYNNEIRDDLLKKGIDEKNILEFPTQSADAYMQFDSKTQYFDQEVILPVENEVFIDCGCFLCDTVKQFINWCSDYKEIVAYEPELEQYNCSVKIAEELKLQKFRIYHGGVYSYTGRAQIVDQGGGSFIKEEDGNITVYALSELETPSKVTLIKMDIEGSELEALKGAEKLIKKDHPRLAISIYHKKTDPITIIDWIMSLDLGYNIYCRHYSNFGLETIVYAV